MSSYISVYSGQLKSQMKVTDLQINQCLASQHAEILCSKIEW